MGLAAQARSSVAWAQEDLRDPLARDLKHAGDEAMQSLRYEEALEAYERATAIEPHPVLLFNRGRALQALRRYPEALDHFEAFSREASPELLARAGKLQELMDNLRDRIATLEIACSVRGATVLVRNQKVGITPLDAPLRVNAGPATVIVLADGYEAFRGNADLRGRSTERIEARLVRKRHKTLLRVRSPARGAVASVDGTVLGSVPTEVAVEAGTHRVRLEHPDYVATETSVEVESGKPKTLSVSMQAKPGILSRWWFWAGTAAVVAGAVTLTIALSTEKEPDAGDIPPGVLTAPLRF